MSEPIYKEESYKLIGLCMEVHRELGRGHNEVIYKDALEFELGQSQNAHVKQVLNYLAASKLKLGLLVNFGEDSLSYKRVVL